MKKLLSKKYNYIFFSPHIDDAVLSCGGLIASLKGKKILVVDIFTNFLGEKYSKHAKYYLKSLKFADASEYFTARKEEEKKAARILNFDFYFCNFPEAIFRFEKKIIFNNFFYKNTEQLLSGINKRDKKIIFLVKKRVDDILKDSRTRNGKIYFPLGIGNHADHKILNKIGLSLKNKNIFFYQDFPYCVKEYRQSNYFKAKKVFLANKDFQLKSKAIRQYKSQLRALFKNIKGFKKLFSEFYRNGYEEYFYISQNR